MKVTITRVNGRESLKYIFSSDEKRMLNSNLPLDPCLKCPSRHVMCCCGCSSKRSFDDKIFSMCKGDKELISLVNKVIRFRYEKEILDKSLEAWKKKVDSTLPNQIKDSVNGRLF